MKKRLLSIIIVLLGMVSGALADVTIDENHFPDWHFRSYVKNYCELERFDGVLTNNEIAQITEINIVGADIEDLTGIEYFTELKELDVFGNSLTSIDVSQNTKLERLDCGSNQLTSIDVSKNTVLRMLFCSGNQLTSLDVSNNPKLAYLDCSNNQIGYAEMKKLVESLPLCQPTTELRIGQFTVLDRDNDQNIITAAQVDIAKAKNWRVVSYSPYGGSEDYNGYRGIPITETYFPDEYFRSLVRNFYDTGNDGFLSYEEIEAVTEIYVSSKGIASLKGIEHFTALKILSCYYNQLTTLDVSGCSALTTLTCYSNQLTELDVSGCTALTELDCGSNQLTSLDVTNNTALENLSCYSNQLTELDVSKNTALKYLWCFSNQLTELDVSKNTKLDRLDCGYNQLTTLDVSQNTALTYLHCSYNRLTEIDLSCCTVLTELWCDNNQLSYLVGLSDCISLIRLDFQKNQICGDAMTYLVNNLRTFDTNTEYPGWMTVYYEGVDDGNEMTTRQVKEANDKGWRVKMYDGGNWVDYSGVPFSVAIDEDNFHDEKFRNWLLGKDYGADGVLTEEEIGAITTLDVSGLGIEDLSGIQYFTSLTKLVCSNNKIEALWLSANTAITELWIDNNQIWGYMMKTLIRDLSDNGGVIRVISSSATEGNGITTQQVNTLKAKGWSVLKSDGTEYEGIAQGVPINERSFPDQMFNYMVRRGVDSDGDDYLNEVELRNWTSFGDVLVNRQIKSLEGIEYFTSLNELKCWINNIDGSFVSLLPVTTDGKLYYFYGEGRDFNTMTPAQVYTANQKGWRVLREDGSDYLGVIVEGDADGNGEVGTQDVERLSDYILGRNSSAFSLKSADLDDNGTVDITDLTLLIEKLKKVKR